MSNKLVYIGGVAYWMTPEGVLASTGSGFSHRDKTAEPVPWAENHPTIQKR